MYITIVNPYTLDTSTSSQLGANQLETIKLARLASVAFSTLYRIRRWAHLDLHYAPMMLGSDDAVASAWENRWKFNPGSSRI